MDEPIVKATLQATFLAATSNILAQCLDAYQNNTPISLEYGPLLIFTAFALLNTPPNFLWQQLLESSFPGYDVKPAVVEKGGEKKSEIVPQQRLNWQNTAIKFTLDQTVGAAVNTVLFCAGMGALRGMGWDEIVLAVRQDFWPLMSAGYKLWPLVSLLSFTVIPVHQRIVFGSLVGVGWNIFLCLFTAGH